MSKQVASHFGSTEEQQHLPTQNLERLWPPFPMTACTGASYSPGAGGWTHLPPASGQVNSALCMWPHKHRSTLYSTSRCSTSPHHRPSTKLKPTWLLLVAARLPRSGELVYMGRWPEKTIHGVTFRSTAARSFWKNCHWGLPRLADISVFIITKCTGPWSNEYQPASWSPSGTGIGKRSWVGIPHSPPESRPPKSSPEFGQSRSWLPCTVMYGAVAVSTSIWLMKASHLLAYPVA
mmetsp:Transcript_87893/g.253535  ORF Transcript_87893/g.253535 Transcript_87893/m.253535 type:complete len:235 (-) Transcript_87893:1105-1809(-)